jgi:integrase
MEVDVKLTASQVKAAIPRIKAYKLSDGRGLYLLVHPNGAKYWRLKYRFDGREKLLAIGVHPDISLAQARAACDEAKALLRDNRDPSSVKQLRKNFLLERSHNTFEAIADEWFAQKISGMSNGYKDRIRRLLEKDLFPIIGKIPVAELSAVKLLGALRIIERRTVYTAHRAKQTSSQILRYAIATGCAERDVAADLTGALKPRTVKSAPTLLNPQEIGQLLRSIDAYAGSLILRAALQLSPMLFVRPGELRTMEWDEIDWSKAQWEIPAIKMKMREAHIVPLARQALEVLEQIQPITGRNKYVFPSARKGGRPLSDNGVRTALRSMGYSNEQITPHGFRAMARTLLDEELGFRIDYIEHQLAHAVKDPLGRAYNRTKHLGERAKMMQRWADYLDEFRRKT